MVKCKEWKRDKKGIKVAKIIISNITDKVYKILEKFISNMNKYNSKTLNIDDDSDNDSDDDYYGDNIADCSDSDDSDDDDDDDLEYKIIANYLSKKTDTERMKLNEDSFAIISYINTKKLQDDILKHIASHFDIMCLTKKKQNDQSNN